MVIILYIEDIETNLWIAKHTLRVFTVYHILNRLSAKVWLEISFMCLFPFVAF